MSKKGVKTPVLPNPCICTLYTHTQTCALHLEIPHGLWPLARLSQLGAQRSLMLVLGGHPKRQPLGNSQLSCREQAPHNAAREGRVDRGSKALDARGTNWERREGPGDSGRLDGGRTARRKWGQAAQAEGTGKRKGGGEQNRETAAWPEPGSVRRGDGGGGGWREERRGGQGCGFHARPPFLRGTPCTVHVYPRSHAPCSAHAWTVYHAPMLSQVHRSALR